eukprot:CAMPEP_0196808182 /NCGR_PEP_ID=MMETSP1362-20130617/8171_1 /TAXON_ID=163516 /ORGANISM="Leptocylindrus danicus, Strain CCMP1856" /LENGTH=546 /DNA_ID=CAMNT_0042182417 /DNA_START=279 /DNA_END=1919 /DNA_ORIENTATION=+
MADNDDNENDSNSNSNGSLEEETVAAAMAAVNQMLVTVSSSSSSSSLGSDVAVATAAAAAALGMGALSEQIATGTTTTTASTGNSSRIGTSSNQEVFLTSSGSGEHLVTANGAGAGVGADGQHRQPHKQRHRQQRSMIIEEKKKKKKHVHVHAAATQSNTVSSSSRKQATAEGTAIMSPSKSSSSSSSTTPLKNRGSNNSNNHSNKQRSSSSSHTSASGVSSSSSSSSTVTKQTSHNSHPTATATATATATSSNGKSTLRRGKWTLEEEAYVARVIRDFNSGHLAAPAGTTLRTYLSEKLHCDPMRITKKFTGDACIGKRVFHPAVRTAANAATIDQAQAELETLEKKWRQRLEAQQREASKKAGLRHHHNGSIHPSVSASHDVTRTAAWLDQADILLQSAAENYSPPTNSGSSSGRVSCARIEEQMENVKRLLQDGPIIQQTSSSIPKILEASVATSTNVAHDFNNVGDHEPSKRKVSECAAERNRAPDDASNAVSSSDAEKKIRKSSSTNALLAAYDAHNDAEDAEALVGFINAVRRERAYSQG